jgi:alpha-L-rhamnosidase
MLLGDLIIWYYENLAGLKPDPVAPGFKKILLQPDFIEGLDFVRGSYHAVYGTIKSHWTRKGENIEWLITIPANTSAEIRIPVTTAREVTESGQALSKAYGINRIKKAGQYLYLELGSGNYRFIFTIINK